MKNVEAVERALAFFLVSLFASLGVAIVIAASCGMVAIVWKTSAYLMAN